MTLRVVMVFALRWMLLKLVLYDSWRIGKSAAMIKEMSIPDAEPSSLLRDLDRQNGVDNKVNYL